MRDAFGAGDGDARPDRRPQAGDLRLPRRRRLRLPRGRRERPATQRDARRQLAQRPGADRRLRRAVRRRAARPRGDRLPHGPGRAAEPARRGCTARRSTRRCGCASSRRDDRAVDAHRQGLRRRSAGARAHIADDLAADLVALLSSGRADRAPRRRTAPTLAREPVAPGSRRGARAHATATPRSCATRCDAAGVPAVINGAGSVFATAAGARVAAAARGARAPASDPRARTPRR